MDSVDECHRGFNSGTHLFPSIIFDSKAISFNFGAKQSGVASDSALRGWIREGLHRDDFCGYQLQFDSIHQASIGLRRLRGIQRRSSAQARGSC